MGASRPFVERRITCDVYPQEHGEYVANVLGADGAERWLPGCPKCARELEMAGIIGRAAIPPRFQAKTFAGFDARGARQKAVLEQAVAYARDFEDALVAGRGMMFCGKPGTGKTHLACAILNEVVRKSRAGLYATVASAVRRVKDTWSRDSDETEREAIALFVQPDLLVLDEVGVQFGSETEKLILFEIVNGRYEQVRPTILLSNLDVKGVEDNIGYRAVDRLREGGGRIVVFDWESRRTEL